MIQLPKEIPTDVANLFVEMARKARAAGIRRTGAKTIIEQMRWFKRVEQGVRTFKVNNNWAPALARWAMDNNPELAGLFETRTTKEESYDAKL